MIRSYLLDVACSIARPIAQHIAIAQTHRKKCLFTTTSTTPPIYASIGAETILRHGLRSELARVTLNGAARHTMPGLQDITNTPRGSLAQRKRHSVSPQPQRRLSFATPKVVDSPEEHDDAPAAADELTALARVHFGGR